MFTATLPGTKFIFPTAAEVDGTQLYCACKICSHAVDWLAQLQAAAA